MYTAKLTELAENDILSSLKYISEVLNAPKASENLYYKINEFEERLSIIRFLYGRRD